MKTGIYKAPVEGPVMVRRLNLDGDVQADLRVHGGIDKAVYLYPSEHYESWRAELQRDLPYGNFGENLTIRGLTEDVVRIDDVLSVGEVLLQVTQPRVPCFKLGIKMADQRFLRRFLESGRSGFYCKVLREGLIEAEQEISLVSSDPEMPPVGQIVDSMYRQR